MPAPRVITDRLPRYLGFSSTREPDPEREIQVALKAAFAQLLEDEELVGPVRRVEQDIRTRLEGEAAGLCAHIRARCPELTEIQVVPAVSFVEGFRGVEVVAARGEERASGWTAPARVAADASAWPSGNGLVNCSTHRGREGGGS